MEPAPPAAADSRASMAAGRVQDLEMALMKRELRVMRQQLAHMKREQQKLTEVVTAVVAWQKVRVQQNLRAMDSIAAYMGDDAVTKP